MTPNLTRDSQSIPDDETLRDDLPSPNTFKESATYAKNRVTEDLHPAFEGSGLKYDTSNDCFAAESEDLYDEAALFDSQKAFSNALEQFQQGVKPKYKSAIDLRATHTWNEVMEYADEARKKYTGVGQRGILKKIDHGLKTFQTAAPAIEAWLKLLPSTSIYGSVAAVHLRKLRKETLSALDEMPLRIEKAQFFMRTYGYQHVNQQMENLYVAIIDALQHILGWYKHAAGLKYISAFCKGPAYAEMLKTKMKNVEKASQAMDERASERQQDRLKTIQAVTGQTHDQVGQLKILAVEARNHLYNVFKDSEMWQEVLQSWKESKSAKEARRVSRNKAILEQEAVEEKNVTARRSLLDRFGPLHDDPSRDVEYVLSQIESMTLADQDRVGAMVEHKEMQGWLLNPLFGALLVHGNSRRYDPFSPTSVACALLIHVFWKKLSFPTLYWFCGLHSHGAGGNPLGMLRSLICQLLCLSCCRCSMDDQNDLDTQDLKKLLDLFQRLLRRSSEATPVVCILDGVSYYESRHQCDDTGKIVRELTSLAKSNPPILILLLTSPIRTTYISREPKILQRLTIAEIPDHVSGAKMGLGDQIISSTETRARKLSESLASGSKSK
ncbi:MAG: hypothetical protein Q9191_006209 [Dirinaria sp. TL-2023a]